MGYTEVMLTAITLFSLFASLALVRRRRDAKRRQEAMKVYIEKYVRSSPANVYRIDEYRDECRDE